MAAEHVRALGERIRLRREELGMTQDEVARQMSGTVDGQRISKWERGENRPRDESLEDLARVLETTPAALLMSQATSGATPDPIPVTVTAESELAGILRQIQEQLADQTRVLEEIKSAVATERTARTEAERAAEELRGLLRALGDANRALLAEPPRAAEARGRRAK